MVPGASALKAYLGIRRMFFVNDIHPGQKISYGELAKRLGMSTTPVIQTLKRLDDQGLVRYEPNRGYFTEEISLKEIIEISQSGPLVLVEYAINRIGKKVQNVYNSHICPK